MSEVKTPKEPAKKATQKKPAAPAKKAAGKLAPGKGVPKAVGKKTVRNTAKVKSHPDIKGDAPVAPDKDPRPEYVVRGLELGLNLKEIEFVETYLTCYNAVRTYMAVYATDNYNMAGVESHKILRRPKVRTYLGERMKAAFSRTEAAQDQIIQTYTMIAYGDVNELVEHRREACRYCHGIDHAYQYTPAELANAMALHERQQDDAARKHGPGYVRTEFEAKGGVGFNPHRDPHPECPECFGVGISSVHMHDTRNLSAAALALYEGVEVTKDGIKIKTASRDAAREKLAKILNVYRETTDVNLTVATTEELDAIYAKAMAEATAQSLAARGRKIDDGG